LFPRCLDNCQVFEYGNECPRYCKALADNYLKSNEYGNLYDCKTLACCHQLAGTNDYRYRLCRERLLPKPAFTGNTRVVSCPWIVVGSLLLLVLILRGVDIFFSPP